MVSKFVTIVLRSTKCNNKMEDTRRIYRIHILSQIKTIIYYYTKSLKGVYYHTQQERNNSYVLKISLHQAHVLLNNGSYKFS